MPRRRAKSRKAEPVYTYEQIKYGGVSKIGQTNNPRRRARENARDGFGNLMVVTGKWPSRTAAKRAESRQIRSHARRHGRRPWGNERR